MDDSTSRADPADPDVALVLRAYEAFARGDIDAAVADLADDVEWTEPDEFLMGGRMVGPAEVADYLRHSRAGWAELTSRRTVYRRDGKLVVVHEVSGRLHDGSERAAAVADVFTVVQGRVVRMQAYADPRDAFA